jgi:hypothetical protein
MKCIFAFKGFNIEDGLRRKTFSAALQSENNYIQIHPFSNFGDKSKQNDVEGLHIVCLIYEILKRCLDIRRIAYLR